MRIPSPLLFGLRLGFTVVKSLALLFRRRAKVRTAGSVLAFIVEVLLGLALSLLLALEVWMESGAGVAALLTRIATIAILATEVLSSVVEGVLMWWRCRHCALVANTQRRVAKDLARLIAFAAGAAALGYLLVNSIVSRRGLLRIVLLAVAAGVEALIGLLAFAARGHPRLRSNVALLGAVGGAVVAVTAVLGERSGQASASLEPQLQTAVYAATLGSAATSVVSWSVPDLGETRCIDCEHARVFETVAVGVVAPLLGVAVSRGRADAVQDFVLTILPQATALVVPLIFTYLATIRGSPADSTSPAPAGHKEVV